MAVKRLFLVLFAAAALLPATGCWHRQSCCNNSVSSSFSPPPPLPCPPPCPPGSVRSFSTVP